MWSHREHLLKVARRRSMSAEDAEDAVHEAMLRAAENPHLDDARLGAWLTTVTMRICVDRHRQVHREAEVRTLPKLTAPGPVPVDEVVCDRAEATWIAYRSRELPARQAEALRLKAQDRDVEQVAREMGLSYEAVESLLARARRTLRNSLAGTLGLALWLVGRGGRASSQAGGNVQAAAMASAAALAVVGLALPFSYDPHAPHDPDRARPPRPAASAGDGAADTVGYEVPTPPSVGPARYADGGAPPVPAPAVSPQALPSLIPPLPEVLPEVALPGELTRTAVPEMPLPRVPLPEASLPGASLPGAPLPDDVPLPQPELPAAELPEPLPDGPAPRVFQDPLVPSPAPVPAS